MHTPADTIDSHLWPTARAKNQPANLADPCDGSYLVEVVVLTDELLQLRLHIYNTFGRELELDYRHPSFLEVLQESHLGRLQKHQASTFSIRAPSR